jgi:hypothetical protein
LPEANVADIFDFMSLDAAWADAEVSRFNGPACERKWVFLDVTESDWP